MSLVSFDELTTPSDKPISDTSFAEVIKFESKVRSVIIHNREKLVDAIGKIKNGEDVFFMNLGRWSAHDILFYLLSITGPADVYFTAWAISEKAARLMQSALDTKLIKNIYGVLDRRIEIRNPKVIAFVRNFSTNLVFVDCHAKLFVIENEQWKISILNTANLSNNLRIEAGQIYTNQDIAQLIKHKILDIIKTGKPFEFGAE